LRRSIRVIKITKSSACRKNPGVVDNSRKPVDNSTIVAGDQLFVKPTRRIYFVSSLTSSFSISHAIRPMYRAGITRANCTRL